jgi:hypothetical protein
VGAKWPELPAKTPGDTGALADNFA